MEIRVQPCKISPTDHPSLHFNGTIFPQVKKHLGLVFDTKLSLEKDHNTKGTGIIKHVSKFLSIKFLDQM